MTIACCNVTSAHLLMDPIKQHNRQTRPPKKLLNSSCHVKRILVVPTIVEQGKIRVGNEQLLVITGALIAKTVTQRAKRFHYRWYMFLLHWIIQSLINLRCPWFVNSHSYPHITLLVITGALIARTVTQMEMICYHRRYLCLLHWIINSLI